MEGPEEVANACHLKIWQQRPLRDRLPCAQDLLQWAGGGSPESCMWVGTLLQGRESGPIWEGGRARREIEEGSSGEGRKQGAGARQGQRCPGDFRACASSVRPVSAPAPS